ncbi:FecCD family ABC transporter permease [Salipaludibacillus sp. HK11]|uniref:FecCD family ABC transporter permease n=1 Tax=Salipaludibacillus sp. HK11 TaxID=3394320 RepID=UPI0039FD5DD1
MKLSNSLDSKKYFLVDTRTFLLLLVLIIANIFVLLISIGVGEYFIAPFDVLKTIFGMGNPDYDFIVYSLRLPRALVAFLVGVGLAVSGTILQGITRNPLASPGVIGINAGASLAAVIVIVLLPSLPLSLLPFAAFGGALLAALVTYIFGWKGGTSPIRLILVGIGVSTLANAFLTVIIMFGNINLVTQATIWMTGSVYARSWEHLLPLISWLIVLLPITFIFYQNLNILHLGDNIAKGLGIRLEWDRGILILLSVALAGVSVATAGAVNFVGLMAPHITKQLVGTTNHGILLPASALMGGLIVVTSDLIGRTVLTPYEIPVGVITAIIGAPYLLYLLFGRKNL